MQPLYSFFKKTTALLFVLLANHFCNAQTTDTLILQDIIWDQASRARQIELMIPSEGSLLQGFIYKANGAQKHPTLLLLHGYPGNERNLDLGQVARARGWNVIFFDYRGSWGSQGQFSFKNCVEDVKNVVAFCKKYSDSLQIDTFSITLFGHSMGGWICLKALSEIPNIKKGIALSTWDIGGNFKEVKTEDEMYALAKNHGEYFVLNTPVKERFIPVFRNISYYDLTNDAPALKHKQIMMLDEHPGNKHIADAIKKENDSFFDYEVWQTDHPFTNKRVALIKKVLAFLAQ